MKISRRGMIVGLGGLVGLNAFPGHAAAIVMTPRSAEGPFYPTPFMRNPDSDNDLVKVKGYVEAAGGEIITLRGTISYGDGKPLSGCRIEIWQCDMDGNYMHPRDRRSANFDETFQGFGHDIADHAGRYTFRTIKPAVYPGRAPHIHVKVLQDGNELLTTQFYIKDHPMNSDDFLFKRMTDEEARSVSMAFSVDGTEPEAIINLVV